MLYLNIPIIHTFNFDLETNKLLTNSELLAKYDLNFESSQEIVDKTIQVYRLGHMDSADHSKQRASNVYDTYDYGSIGIQSVEVSEFSRIFIDENGKL